MKKIRILFIIMCIVLCIFSLYKIAVGHYHYIAEFVFSILLGHSYIQVNDLMEKLTSLSQMAQNNINGMANENE